MTNVNNYPICPDVCFIAEGYKGTKEVVNTYLGVDRHISIDPTCTLKARFDSDVEVDNFLSWWTDETKEGYKNFIVTTKLFAVEAEYVVRQITPIVHLDNKVKTLSFSVEILERTDLISNMAPTAIPMKIYLAEGSKDNFVILKGHDLEGDMLSFSVTLPPAHGTLTGVAPNLLYTPTQNFKGTDCFNFIVKDRYHESTYATVEIDVGVEAHASAEFRYVVHKDGIVVGNNYHYRLGSDPLLYKTIRGHGGTIKPAILNGNYGEITIWSDDHTVESGDVQSVSVVNWGERVNYTELMMGETGSFDVSQAMGSCKGEIFTRMFKDSDILVPHFDTANGIYFDGMFENHKSITIPSFDTVRGVYYNQMYKNCKALNYGYMHTSNGRYFQEMFLGSDYICIPDLHTTYAINTSSMFGNNQNMRHPDASEQQALMNKGYYAAPSGGCGVRDLIIKPVAGSETLCDITALGGTCTSSSSYEAQSQGAIGSLKYMWTTSTAGASIDNMTAQTIKVSVTTGAEPFTVSLKCKVTDKGTGKHITSGVVLFTTSNNRPTYPIIDLAGAYKVIDLATVIGNEVPASYTGDVVVKNSRVQPSLKTGDLSKYSKVLLENTGKFQGLRNSGFGIYDFMNGITATSAITIDNRGSIQGAGGFGGKGGRGLDDQYVEKTELVRYNEPKCIGAEGTFSWTFHCARIKDYFGANDHKFVWIWDTRRVETRGEHPNDIHISGLIGEYRFDTHQTMIQCNGRQVELYGIKQIIGVIKPRRGGAGGLGGLGEGFNHYKTYGDIGSPSEPRGGNSGYRGGLGGDFGVRGGTGLAGGATGYDAGKAVKGTSNITWIAKGNLTGDEV